MTKYVGTPISRPWQRQRFFPRFGLTYFYFATREEAEAFNA